MAKAEQIILGSGQLYLMEYTGEIPTEDATIETPENILGAIKGGASLEYKPDHYTAEDDLGFYKKIILTKEDVTFKSGIMTINGNTMARLCSTARVTEDTEKKIRTVKIGGAKNQDGKSYLLRFVHKDAKDGDIRITIVGKNEAGFTLAFAKDKETVIDAEFKAEPCDDDGTLITYTEEIKTAVVVKATKVKQGG